MTTARSFCRFCTGFCPLEVEIENGLPVAARGEPGNPLYDGFFCLKGRDFGTLHTHPNRWLSSQRRRPNGGFDPISSESVVTEVADRLSAILDRDGPRAVAMYSGTVFYQNASTAAVATAWMNAIRSPMRFSSGTIDQPGKQVSAALHGTWLAGGAPLPDCDAWLIVGSNPLVAISGPQSNPAKLFKNACRDGLALVVIDPRRTEVARLAEVHLQSRPGFDPHLLAAMMHAVFETGLADQAFLSEHARGVSALKSAVAPFSPERIAPLADVDAADIRRAAKLFAKAQRGTVQVGTGPNMARNGNLTEYLGLCLTTLTGHWRRAGDRVTNPPVLAPDREFKAQASPPYPARNLGFDLRVRDFSLAACGLPTSALADEILLPGGGQVKALFVVGGNPLMAWPDQAKTDEALKALELLVVLDPKPTATAELAHYVVAPKLGLEIADSTLSTESLSVLTAAFGFPVPHAQYAPPVVEPPAGSDLLEDWEFFYGLAKQMDLPLRVQTGLFPSPGVGSVRSALDMKSRPSSDELLDLLTCDSRIALDVVRAHAGPGVFEAEPVFVQPADPVPSSDSGDRPRLELGDAAMLGELAVLSEAFAARTEAKPRRSIDPVRAAAPATDRAPVSERPYRLISRRMANAFNSMGTDHPDLRGRYGTNPAFMHPTDLADLGLARGDLIRVESDHGAVETLAWPDPALRRGLVSMSHCWGASPTAAADRSDTAKTAGANVGLLISVEEDYDPYSGIPWMSGFPVSVCGCESRRRE